MAANYVLLEKITVGAAGASSVTFSGIPQTGYTDLVVKASPRSDRTGNVKDTLDLKFNGTSTGLSEKYLQGNGTSATSGSLSNYYAEINAASSTASVFSNLEIYIPNYTSANYKSFSIDTVMEDNATLAIAELFAGLWSNTAAITSLTLSVVNGTGFTQYSTFYLYGVAALGTTPAIQPYATGGDTIMTDGTYWYHTFISNGTFTPAKGLSCDVLVVAGGGGGGYYYGSGGGGGGLLEQTGRSVTTSTAYTVTIGAGGAKSPAVAVNNVGSVGSNSIFDTITAIGGGGGNGGFQSNSTATPGGSSGGMQAGTATTHSQGNSGGATGYGFDGAVNMNGAGGGGAGANGSSGNGGNGRANSITGTSVTYAGGGGGQAGTNGTGGGPTANRGGGGKGDNENGGSGIVIIRYAV